MELIIHFDTIIYSNEISNSFQFNYKLQSDLRILSNWIIKVIYNADFWSFSGGDYLIEIVGRCLNVYGQGALRFIDRSWDPLKAADVNIVKFNYVQFSGIATVLSKLKSRFPNSEHFIFKETNISHLGQINALAEVQGLTSIQIEPEGNPIISKDWRNYTIFRLAHWGLKVINGREVGFESTLLRGYNFFVLFIFNQFLVLNLIKIDEDFLFVPNFYVFR